MSSPDQAPFARLVEYFKGALQSVDRISIPAEILFAFKNTAPPLEDTGLRDLVKLFDGSHPGNRLRLDSTVLAQLIQIVFRLRASLLQHKLIYSLLVPPQETNLDTFKSWRTSISGKLMPTILRSLQDGALAETLLIAVAHSLALLIDGDEGAKSMVFSGQDTLRRALGTIVSKHDSYVLRIAVANLIREFMTGRFDRHIFWPHDIPAPFFNDFPLAQAGDAEWLANAVEFLSAANTSKAFRADLPDAYLVQYSEYKHSVAIISDAITLVLPATARYPLRFLQLPLIDGMVCHSTDGPGNEVTIRYRRTTGYQISQGVKRAVEDIHLVLRDHAQSIAFVQSVQSRLAKRFEGKSPALGPKLASQRTSYASIDLSQSRETSIESEEEANDFTQVPESAVSVPSPSLVETQGAAESQIRQERTTDESHDLSQVRINNYAQPPTADATPKISPDLRQTRKKEASEGSPQQKSAMSSIRADGAANETMKDSQRRLKRRSTKGAGNANKNDIDWDEDLRDDDIETEAPAAKKVKSISKKAEKSENTATGKIAQTKSKRGNTQKKKSKSKTKPSKKTATTTRTRRTAVTKSAKYVEESESDLDDGDDEQPSSVVQDSNPLTTKNALSKKDEIHVDDSQGQEDGGGLYSYELDSVDSLPAEESSSATPLSAAKGKTALQDEAANNFLPMDNVAKSQALAQDDTSFGTKIAQILKAKAHLSIAAIEQPSRKSFGDVKKFVEAVNVTRNSSPQKNPVQLESHNAAIHQTPWINQRPANSTAHHSLAQVQDARPSKRKPETARAHRGPAQESQLSDNADKAHQEAAPISIPGEDVERAASTSAQKSDLEVAAPKSIPEDDLDLAALAVSQATYQEAVLTTVTTIRDTGEENQVTDSNTRAESLETELSKPAIMASKWSPDKGESRKILKEIPKGVEAQKSMDPPPLPRRSDRGSIRSPTRMTSDEGDSTLLMTDERIQRKTPIVSFGVQGPRNQCVVSPSKQPEVADAPVPVPPETGKHAAAKRQKKTVPFELITFPALAATSEVSDQSSEASNDDEGILVQAKSAYESVGVGQSSDVNDEDDGVRAQEKGAIDTNADAGATSRRNALQSSRVDKNGSPRLHQPPKSLISPANLQGLSATSERFESSAFASDELEHSIYTESNSPSPAIFSPEHLPQRAQQPPKAKMTQTRTSIGLQGVLSETFPAASKSVNTAAFKKQIKPTLSRPTVVFEKRSTADQKARNAPQTKPSTHPQVVQVNIDRAPRLSSPQQQLISDLNTRVTRLGPKTLADASKVVEGASPTPTSFKTGFKNMLMPPPPVPPPRQGQTDLGAASAGKGKRQRGPTTEDEDLTLIDDEDSVEHRPIRQTARRQRHQSPDASRDSQSSPMPEQMQSKKNSRTEDLDPSSLEIRFTQQHILNILSRTATGVLFRLQAAEQAIQSKTQEYHLGCYTLIDKLETTYEACVQHERSRAAPRVIELCESYNTTVEYCSKGLRRVRGGTELRSMSETIEKRRNNLLSLIESQMEETDSPGQEAE